MIATVSESVKVAETENAIRDALHATPMVLEVQRNLAAADEYQDEKPRQIEIRSVVQVVEEILGSLVLGEMNEVRGILGRLMRRIGIGEIRI